MRGLFRYAMMLCTPEDGAGGSAPGVPAATGQPDGTAPESGDGDAAAAAPAGGGTEDLVRQYREKLNRAMSQSTKLERDRVETKKQLDEYRTRYDGIDPEEHARLKGYLKDPTQLVRDGHLTAEQIQELTKGYVNGDLSPKTAAERAVEEARKELEAIKAELGELKQTKEQETKSAGFKADLARVNDMLAAEEDGYPFLAAFDRAEMVTKALYDYVEQTGEKPTGEQIHEYLSQQEQSIVGELKKALTLPAGIAAIRQDKELTAALIAAITGGEGGEGESADGVSEAVPQETERAGQKTRRRTGASPRTITDDVASQVGTRADGEGTPSLGDRKYRESNRARAIAEARRRIQQNKEAGVRGGAF